MNGHALEVLELGAALRLIARRATSDAGRRAVLALLPSHDLDEVRFELERVGAMMDLLQETPTWSPPRCRRYGRSS